MSERELPRLNPSTQLSALLGIGCRSGATVIGLSAVRRAKGLAFVFASSTLAQRTQRELARLASGGTRVFQVQPMEVLTQSFGRQDAQVIGVLRGDLARGLAKHLSAVCGTNWGDKGK